MTLLEQGTCVGYGEDTKCECTPPYLKMSGSIYKMDQPMNLALGVQTNFSFVTVAVRFCFVLLKSNNFIAYFFFPLVQAGGAMFAVSQSECPTDDMGLPCGGKGECVVSILTYSQMWSHSAVS